MSGTSHFNVSQETEPIHNDSGKQHPAASFFKKLSGKVSKWCVTVCKRPFCHAVPDQHDFLFELFMGMTMLFV